MNFSIHQRIDNDTFDIVGPRGGIFLKFPKTDQDYIYSNNVVCNEIIILLEQSTTLIEQSYLKFARTNAVRR